MVGARGEDKRGEGGKVLPYVRIPASKCRRNKIKISSFCNSQYNY